MVKLQVGTDLAIPATIHTSTLALLGIRGAGKSNAARVIAEEFYAKKLPFVAIDPVGAWWGLRARGTSDGCAIPIFGGEHGDVPIDRGGGQVLADFVNENRLSCVVDLSGFETRADKKAFLLAFARRIYQKSRDPLHLMLEEADDYIPQRPMGDELHLLSAFVDIVRRGRSRGLGITLITQRSAAINKEVLTQTENLVVFRTTGPQDRKAIDAWLEQHSDAKEVRQSLPSLANGEAWLWSPHVLGMMERFRFRRCHTFDSGATPTGAARRLPATMADVDLSAVRSQMEGAIERAKADDPKELRRRIAELQKKGAGASAEDLKAEFERGKQEGRRLARQAVNVAILALDDIATGAQERIKRIERAYEEAAPNPAPAVQQPRTLDGSGARAVPPPPRPAKPTRAAGDVTLGKGEMVILAAIAQHQSGVTREQLTILTGYKRSSRDTYLQRLKSAGAVADQSGVLTATESGIEQLGPDFEPLPTGDDLRRHWLDRLSGGEKSLLEIICGAYPGSISRAALSQKSEYQRSSRDTYLQRLAARKLIRVQSGGMVIAAEELFG